MWGQIPEMPGYDLTGVFVGSEGTLGIATEITLRILKTSESICVLADFTSIEAAGAAVSDIISFIPAGMEMMDNPASMPWKMSWQQAVIPEMPQLFC